LKSSEALIYIMHLTDSYLKVPIIYQLYSVHCAGSTY